MILTGKYMEATVAITDTAAAVTVCVQRNGGSRYSQSVPEALDARSLKSTIPLLPRCRSKPSGFCGHQPDQHHQPV
ncbi:hypothetical protein ACVXHB_09090 [Escherichia coli]